MDEAVDALPMLGDLWQAGGVRDNGPIALKDWTWCYVSGMINVCAYIYIYVYIYYIHINISMIIHTHIIHTHIITLYIRIYYVYV